MVQPGYAKCPRCRMPQTMTAAERKAQGGTAVEGGSSRTTFVALALLVVVIAVIVMARDDDADKTPSAVTPPARSTQPAPPPARVTTTPVDDRQIGFTGTETKTESVKGGEIVLRSLEEVLVERRLWSQVSTEKQSPTVINVVSASCGDEQMKPTLERTSVQLKELGYTSLRCVEKNGALVFELKYQAPQ